MKKMKKFPGEEFENLNVKLIFAMNYVPKGMKGSVCGRGRHSCLYIEEGIYKYSFERKHFTAVAGDVIYLPKGSVHRYEIMTETAKCTQVEFDISGGVSFGEFPVVLQNSDEARDCVKEIADFCDGNTHSDYFGAMSALFKLCGILSGELAERVKAKSTIQPAVDFIESHFTENTSTAHLAELCFMSQSQLRRKFAREYKMPPIVYKNRLRIEKAKTMLLYDVASVGEIAERLGFDNVYAFSAMFKKYSGLSPSQFAKNRKIHQQKF